MASVLSILVFGEDDNDISAIRELLLALRPEQQRVEKRRSPPVFIKGIERARDRKNLSAIAAVVKAEERRGKRCVVVAHRDCDAIEPAHEELGQQIEEGLMRNGIKQAVAAVAAWEIEAWWFLWPAAVAQVNSKWRELTPPQPRVGMIPNVKEELRRRLRPRSREKPARDYRESDSPKIASKVRELGIVNQTSALSESFNRFANSVRSLRL